jgi:hypothetical protein
MIATNIATNITPCTLRHLCSLVEAQKSAPEGALYIYEFSQSSNALRGMMIRLPEYTTLN